MYAVGKYAVPKMYAIMRAYSIPHTSVFENPTAYSIHAYTYYLSLMPYMWFDMQYHVTVLI